VLSRVSAMTRSTSASVIVRGAPGTRRVQQAGQPLAHEALPPAAHGLLVPLADVARQHEARLLRQVLRHRRVVGSRF